MIAVNGVDLRDLGFTAESRPRFHRLGGERTTAQAVPGTVGAIRLGGSGEAGALTIRGWIAGADHDDLLARLDDLAAVLQGECVIHLSDHPDREWHGLLQQAPSSASAVGPAWITRVEDATLEWLLPDPLAVARGWTIGDADTPLELGSAPSPIAVDVAASEAVTQITVEVMRGAAVLRSLEWSGELAAGETWSVSDEAHEVTVGAVNAIDGLTPASVFPYADPTERADRVRVTTDGDAMVTVRYRRRWW